MGTMSEASVTFEAVIVPHRSLGRRGLLWLGGSVLVLSGAMACGLWFAGAWPAIGFIGLEAGLALGLLRRHARGARALEMLLLSEGGLLVVRVDEFGRRTERLVPTAWLRADLEAGPGGTAVLMLRAAGVALEVAASLGEDEKRGLAGALKDALHRQRHPTFDNEQLREISSRSVPST